jgi:CheY-like chemotaxis protein/MoaA/NifB/PqqE/SkfB family radical SAM enzyme
MRTVLIVDDELGKPANAGMFSREYPVEGIHYRFAGSGEEMFRVLNEDDTVCAILLDIRFEAEGNLHGLSILKRLTADGHSIPVIMMSSLADADTIIRAWDLGAEAYILKWSDNERFFEDLKTKVLKHARDVKPSSEDLIERRRNRIRVRAQQVLKEFSQLTLDDIVAQARALKQEVAGQWVHGIPFPVDFQNYIRGWNETDEALKDAEENHRLLYLNMDFGDGCALRCPHCFTMEGAIDARGRNQMAFDRVKESILEAKELGLRHVRILGRGEPTQWIANPSLSGGLRPKPDEDLIDFIQFLHRHEVTPLIFTRGHVLGDESRITKTFGGVHGVNSGEDLIRLLADNGVSIFLGVSSIFPEVNEEMVGIPKQDHYNFDVACRRALRLCVAAGLSRPNPTRLAVEMPITNLNITEMAVRYVLFQCLNISPCTNVYMVTGRAITYGLGEITDPPQEQFLEQYSMVMRFARNMGIDLKIGPYAGTKECHDVSCGMYLTLNGDIYPCPGYEGIQNVLGSARRHSLKDIWENSPYGGHPQSICSPKIGTHFPPDFEHQVERCIKNNTVRFDEIFAAICQGLGVPTKISIPSQ